jgi:two-component system, OmpR family, sensor kinase
MRSFWPGRWTASLFGQLLALIGLSLILSQALILLLFVALPPPVNDFYRLSEVVQTFRGEAANFNDRRPLGLSTAEEPPVRPMRGRWAPILRAELAKALRVSPRSVVVGGVQQGPFDDRRVYHVVRSRMARSGGERDEAFMIAPFKVGVQQPDGTWFIVQPEPGIGLSPLQRRVALWFLLATLVTAPFAYLVARRLSAPIRVFAQAAERLGRDPRAPPVALKGTAEIKAAARAFNEMQERLRRYVEDRTAMMGAIAHDLRTPLTRLRFRIENAPEELRAKMAADIDQMEEMISAALTFVRDASQGGERTPLELSSLLESLCDEMAETGQDTEVARSDKVVVEGDPLALRRLFANLLENAVKFGTRARVRVFREGPSAIVEIDDDGPGIPTAELDRVFEPFYRREPSRNRQTGGIGLGLATVRSVARGHGGDVVLANRAGGGLTARVQLPI